MSETYVECLVARKPSIIGTICQWILTIVAGIAIIFGLIASPISFIVGIAFGVGAWFVKRYSNVEFEYLYLDKELSVDKILDQSKRKKAANYDIDGIEIIAPVNSHELDSYKNRQVKVKDFSTGIADTPDSRYVMYYKGEEKVIFNPSEDLLKAIKTVAPRKVFQY